MLHPNLPKTRPEVETLLVEAMTIGETFSSAGAQFHRDSTPLAVALAGYAVMAIAAKAFRPDANVAEFAADLDGAFEGGYLLMDPTEAGLVDVVSRLCEGFGIGAAA